MRFPSILQPAAVLALSLAACAVAAPAQAVTVPIAGSSATSGEPSLRTINFDFTLPAGFTGAQLHISNLVVDDRGVLRLNGTDIDSAGISIPGASAFDFGSGNVPYVFGANGAHDVTVSSGFLTGLNSLRLWINDTGAGVTGNLVNGPNGPSGTTGYDLAATLTYQVAPSTTGAVPEPGAWALMILGFGGVGASLRARHRRPAIA